MQIEAWESAKVQNRTYVQERFEVKYKVPFVGHSNSPWNGLSCIIKLVNLLDNVIDIEVFSSHSQYISKDEHVISKVTEKV